MKLRKDCPRLQDLTDARSHVHTLQAELVSKDLAHEGKTAEVLSLTGYSEGKL